MEGDFINFGLKPEKKTLKFKVLELLLALNYWWTLLFHKFVRSQERKIAEKFQTPAQKRTFYEHVTVELLVVLFDHTLQYMNGKLRRHNISSRVCIWIKMFAILSLYNSTRVTRYRTFTQHILFSSPAWKTKEESLTNWLIVVLRPKNNSFSSLDFKIMLTKH